MRERCRRYGTKYTVNHSRKEGRRQELTLLKTCKAAPNHPSQLRTQAISQRV
jgi:hypothetical protein